VGVTIHEWNESILHAKLATIDGSRLLIGSFNLDPFSLASLEVLVEVADTKVVSQAEAWIQDHFARSRSMTSLEAGSRLQRWLHEPFGRVVARLVDMYSRITVGRRRRKHIAHAGKKVQE
jgi:cardiolipin synthase